MSKMKTLKKQAFDLLGARTFKTLSLAYTAIDQRLMKEKRWDPTNPDLITNQVKAILEKIDPETLDMDRDHEWWNEILWFWYHHAAGWALYTKQDKELALEYANQALIHQCPNHSNRVTRLLWFIAQDDLDSAHGWIKDMTMTEHPDEFETCWFLFNEFKKNHKPMRLPKVRIKRHRPRKK